MPEGPSIVILKELVQPFKGKKIIEVDGNSKLDIQRLSGKKITDFKSWGKHFLICFKGFTVRIHFMLFGSYRINERKESVARLRLIFRQGEISFYACSVQFIEGNLDSVYDWSTDVMSPEWNPSAAKTKLKSHPDMLVCDALLDQHIFSGVGNIIKNEVLFKTRVQPEARIGDLPAGKLSEIVTEARDYSFQFLAWKKQFVLKKHWLAHTKKTCPECGEPFTKRHTGKTNRRSFFCTHCQHAYGRKQRR